MHVTYYASRRYHDVIYTPYLKWRLRGNCVIYSEGTTECPLPYISVVFTVYRESRNSDRAQDREVTLHVAHGGQPFDDGLGIEALSCKCVLATTSAMPCVDLTSVISMFPEYSSGHRELRDICRSARLSNDTLFHPYWKGFNWDWVGMVQSHRCVQADRTIGVGDTDDADDFTKREVVEELRRNMSCQNSKHMHDQLFLMVETMGAKRVRNGHNCCPIFTDAQRTTGYRPYLMQTLHQNFSTQSTTPNDGDTRGRGAWTRARSALESSRSGRARATNGSREGRGGTGRLEVAARQAEDML